MVKITFLVNAAVLLEFADTKVLVDGIYDESGHCFSNLSEEQWEDLKLGNKDFSNIDYLLFTHEHGDHFSPRRVLEYLDYQIPKAIFMPKKGSISLHRLQEKVWNLKIPCAFLDETLCRKTIFSPERDIKIKAFWTRHLDRIYWDVPHFCYLIEFGTKKLLFTGDVDFTYETFSELENITLDAVFVNPLMNHSKEGKNLLSKDALYAKKKVVYHIPFDGEDEMMIRKLVEQEIKHEKDTVFFMEKGQICYI